MRLTLLQSVTYITLNFLLPAVLGSGLPRGFRFLKPYKSSVKTAHPVTKIPGLLLKRQSCPIGYGSCASGGGCCPIAGSCCGSDGCCNAGRVCCEGKGCIPLGANCCKDGNYCDLGDECVILPSGQGGCCPILATCVDGGGNSGNGGGGGVGDGGETTTVKQATTTTTPKSTPTILSSLPNTVGFPSPTAFPTTAPTPRPNPNPGQVQHSITVFDASITWSSGWVTGGSSCTSSSKKTTTAMQSFTVMVSSASEIYLGIDSTNADYDVYVDGVLKSFSSFRVTETCSYKQLPSGQSSTNINVTVVVIGILMSTKRQLGGALDWSFQLNEVLTMDSGASGSGGSGSAASSVGGALGSEVSFLSGFAAMSLAGLGLLI